eukprot:227312_1
MQNYHLIISSAASFATSVPVIPIATPISTFFNAGESFTPSPVTATIPPSSCTADKINNFCCGYVRANTTFVLFNSLFQKSATPCGSSAYVSNFSCNKCPGITIASYSLSDTESILPLYYNSYT